MAGRIDVHRERESAAQGDSGVMDCACGCSLIQGIGIDFTAEQTNVSNAS
jgi:hypothetical protein